MKFNGLSYPATSVVSWPLLAAFFLSCTTSEKKSGYEPYPTVIASASLFNQKTPSKLTKLSWQGDWIFRRDRLGLIDKELRDIKPDFIFFQEAVEKQESFSESDLNILAAGSLKNYQMEKIPVGTLEETEEDEFLAVAITTPYHFQKFDEGQQREWHFGKGGFLAASLIVKEDQPILLFNVEMPEEEAEIALWYAFVADQIRKVVQTSELCLNRVVVAGKILVDQDGRKYREFLKQLQMKDSSAGFCQNASKCFTATSINEIFMATVGDQQPAQADRVLLHSSSLIYSSNRIFADSLETKKYVADYGISHLWPTQRFGWSTTVRMSYCD